MVTSSYGSVFEGVQDIQYNMRERNSSSSDIILRYPIVTCAFTNYIRIRAVAGFFYRNIFSSFFRPPFIHSGGVPAILSGSSSSDIYAFWNVGTRASSSVSSFSSFTLDSIFGYVKEDWNVFTASYFRKIGGGRKYILRCATRSPLACRCLLLPFLYCIVIICCCSLIVSHLFLLRRWNSYRAVPRRCA